MNLASPILSTPPPELLSLAETLDDLINFRRFGGALPECYGGELGALTWGHYVRKVHSNSEAGAILTHGADIAQLIVNDPDIDTSALIVGEKGNGSCEAMIPTSIALIEAFEKAGMNLSLYANLEKAKKFREEGGKFVRTRFRQSDTSSHDVDFNKDNPDISTTRVPNVERPRIIMEFGSSRGNIPTSSNDKKLFAEQSYAELQERFAHDRTLCRNGGILIVGSDANQEDSALTPYLHRAHAKFAENVIHRGAREGALSKEFEPQLLYYDPWISKVHEIHGKKFNTVKHDLVASNDRSFGILQASGHFNSSSMDENDHFSISHSTKWTPDIMVMAAKSQGFKRLGIYWGEDSPVPVYVFKAPVHPQLVHA